LNNGISERPVAVEEVVLVEEVMPVVKVEEVYGLCRTLSICQLGSASMMRLGLQVQGKLTIAIVDTAAEVTIVSNKVFRSWDLKPEITRNIQMHAAGRGMSMKAFVTSPVDIKK